MIDFYTFTKIDLNVGDLCKLIVAKGFKKLPKVQKIAQSGHSECNPHFSNNQFQFSQFLIQIHLLRQMKL